MLMEKIATARIHYQAARDELVTRLRLRDQVLFIFLGFVGSLIGIALGVQDKLEILLSIPYVALGCSIVVSQHNEVIGTLIRFINHRVKPVLEAENAYASEFVSSPVFREHSQRSNKFRSTGHALIILTPCLLAIALNWKHAFYSPFPLGPVWWFAFVCSLLAGFIIGFVHLRRQKVYRDTVWENE